MPGTCRVLAKARFWWSSNVTIMEFRDYLVLLAHGDGSDLFLWQQNIIWQRCEKLL